MLQELQIKNFAIIEKQCVSFAPGLNVISGETGAGKSVLLGALELVLGAKPRTNIVRTGEESAEVTALFSLTPELQSTLPEIAQGEELVVTRIFGASGRGKVFINGRLSSLAVLGEVTSRLLSICSQNQHVQLLDSRFHLQHLDGFLAAHDLREQYRVAYQKSQQLSQKVKELVAASSSGEKRRVELEGIVEELSALPLKEGLRAELEAKVKRFSAAETLISGSEQLLQEIQSEAGVTAQLQIVSARLNELARHDQEIGDLRERFLVLREEFGSFEQDLTRYSQKLEIDEDELATLRETLASVARLERKYRTNDGGLLALLEDAQKELVTLQEVQDIDAIAKEAAVAEAAAREIADSLSELRKSAAKKLAKQVEKELAELSMAGARFTVSLTQLASLSSHGLDSCEFMLSANKGESERPLHEIASGGELSRILLVLKKVLREKSGVNVLVFDEVDTGISGAVARAVGEKLKALAESSQVLCITHLPQVASLADRHILVEKQLQQHGKAKHDDTRTVSVVKILDEESRVGEIARMLAGKSITEAALQSARELIYERGSGR